ARLGERGGAKGETAQALSQRSSNLGQGITKQTEQIAEKEITNIGSITEGALNDDTVKLLQQKPALRHALAENSLAARALKKCNTPCYPPNATPNQIRTLEQHLERVKATGNYNESMLREFLYRNRDTLDEAIGDVIQHQTSQHLDSFLRAEFNRVRAGAPGQPPLVHPHVIPGEVAPARPATPLPEPPTTGPRQTRAPETD